MEGNQILNVVQQKDEEQQEEEEGQEEEEEMGEINLDDIPEDIKQQLEQQMEELQGKEIIDDEGNAIIIDFQSMPQDQVQKIIFMLLQQLQ